MGCSFISHAQDAIANVLTPVAQVAAMIPGPWQAPAMAYDMANAVATGNPVGAVASGAGLYGLGGGFGSNGFSLDTLGSSMGSYNPFGAAGSSSSAAGMSGAAGNGVGLPASTPGGQMSSSALNNLSTAGLAPSGSSLGTMMDTSLPPPNYSLSGTGSAPGTGTALGAGNLAPTDYSLSGAGSSAGSGVNVPSSVASNFGSPTSSGSGPLGAVGKTLQNLYSTNGQLDGAKMAKLLAVASSLSQTPYQQAQKALPVTPSQSQPLYTTGNGIQGTQPNISRTGASSGPLAQNIMFQPTMFARGGLAQMQGSGGPPPGLMPTPGGPAGPLMGSDPGQADSVPAMLSHGEFVIPSDVVSHLGDGNNNAGALKLHAFMKGIRQHKGAGPGLPPPSKPITSYMGS